MSISVSPLGWSRLDDKNIRILLINVNRKMRIRGRHKMHKPVGRPRTKPSRDRKVHLSTGSGPICGAGVRYASSDTTAQSKLVTCGTCLLMLARALPLVLLVMAACPALAEQQSIPVPDPTVLTTQAIDARVTELQKLLEARLDGYDRATKLLEDNVNRVPTLLDREIAQTTALSAEKFAGIDQRFRERDVRTDQDKAASTTAVNAALSAQKEAAQAQEVSNETAINKSEAGFTKEIDGLKVLMGTNKDSTNIQINDLIARLNRSETATATTHDVRTDDRLNTGSIVGLVGGAVGILSLLLAFFKGRPPESAVTPNAAGGSRNLGPR
jgi:hypothetical protein